MGWTLYYLIVFGDQIFPDMLDSGNVHICLLLVGAVQNVSLQIVTLPLKILITSDIVVSAIWIFLFTMRASS